MDVRRSFRLAICGLAVLGLTACGDTHTRLRDTEPPRPATIVGSPAATPADDGEVRIAEQGSTQVRDDRVIMYAVVLENTSRDLASRVELTLRLVDANGETVGDESADLTYTAVAPGAHAAAGGQLYVDNLRAVAVRASITGTDWWPVRPGGTAVATFTTSRITHSVDRFDRITLTFGIDSDHHELNSVAMGTAVFRDKQGAVIGGGTDRLSGGPIPPGRSRRQLKVDTVAGADQSRTQVFVTPEMYQKP